jgi:hypothetical protein
MKSIAITRRTVFGTGELPNPETHHEITSDSLEKNGSPRLVGLGENDLNDVLTKSSRESGR